MTPVAEILYAGYSVLTQEGTWCQGARHRETNGAHQYCAIGLLDTIVPWDSVERVQARGCLLKAIGIRGGLFLWNDRTRRNQAQVRAAFLRAAIIAFNQGI